MLKVKSVGSQPTMENANLINYLQTTVNSIYKRKNFSLFKYSTLESETSLCFYEKHPIRTCRIDSIN